ncbi:MAG: hydrogenase maturation protease [Bacteroidetes bacterium]|nr:hydrogenase maturation protease [Bacteroidota bacterium]
MRDSLKILLYGYGNPGRQDDGLGVEFVNRMEKWVCQLGLKGFEFDNNYQLNIEDAEAIKDKDLVVFADASEEKISNFCFTKVNKSSKVSFTTHSASPGYIVKLCEELFNSKPLVLLLHIKGYSWEFHEGLTEKAENNLKIALDYFQKKLKHPEKIINTLNDWKLC